MRKQFISYADLETTSSDKPQIYSWGIMDQDENFSYGIDGISFIEHIEKIEQDTVMYFHNGSKFDAHFIKDLLTKQKYKQRIFLSKSLISILESENKQQEYDNWLSLNSHLNVSEKSLLEPYEYSLLVDGNFKIMEIKIGLPSYKITNNKKKHRVLRIRDSNLLFMGSIKSYGETLNKHYDTDKYSKGEGDSGISYIRNELYESIEEFESDGNELSYLKQDCFILKKYLELAQEKLPFNKWKLTSASTAYSQWNDILGLQIENNLVNQGKIFRNYKDDKKSFYTIQWVGKNKQWNTSSFRNFQIKKLLPTDWLNNDYDDMYLSQEIYRTYRGGLTHANPDYVGIKIKDISITDIVSSYPSVMNSDRLYPIGVPFYNKENDTYGDGGDDYPLKMYKVEILSKTINKNGLPFLPILNVDSNSYEYRDKLDKGQVFYMVDSEYKLFNEFYEGEHEATITFSFKGLTGKQLFGNYINKYFDMKSNGKKKGDQGETLIAKLFLNSLYGKFATKQKRESRYWNDKEYEWEKEVSIIESKFYLPIASYITAYAREKLVRAVGNNYDDFIYCDTDSIFFKGDKIFNNISMSKKLGDWELEYENMEGCAIRPKQYFFTDKDGIKKIGLAGINLFRPDEELSNGEKNFIDTLTLDHMIMGRYIGNQLRPKRHLGYGIQLEDVIKEIKPIWLKTPLYNQWFKSKEEYIEKYTIQKNKKNL